MTDARNPLVARVAVNHIWARHFGKPLVATVFNFGRKGAAPTHPELLDYLAVELRDTGWSMKKLHRLIVTSNAYQMSSSSAGAASTPTGAAPILSSQDMQIDPRRCAMIIQDLQNDVIMDGGAFAESGAPAHAKQQRVIENVRRLAAAARS